MKLILGYKMQNQTIKVTPIRTVSDVRNSVVDGYDYTITDSKIRKNFLWQEQWDVVKGELEHMLQIDPLVLSDEHIECWLCMIKKFGYAFYFKKELNGERITVQYFGSDFIV
jgi:hypothetical protein